MQATKECMMRMISNLCDSQSHKIKGPTFQKLLQIQLIPLELAADGLLFIFLLYCLVLEKMTYSYMICLSFELIEAAKQKSLLPKNWRWQISFLFILPLDLVFLAGSTLW